MRKKELNHYQRFIIANGHQAVVNPGDAAAILLWTCAFRADVAQNSVSEAMRYQLDYPDAKIIIAGCLPDIIKDVIPTNFKGQIIPWREDAQQLDAIWGKIGDGHIAFSSVEPVFVQPALCQDAAEFRKQNPGVAVTFHDQFIKVLVTEGCPFSCTYCAEKLALPPFHSVPPDKIIESIKPFIDKAKEQSLILLADCLGEYGADIGCSLPDILIKLKSQYINLKFALNNLHPASFVKHFDALTEFLQKNWLAHINLPIQSASDQVLARMQRNYTQNDLAKIFEAFKKYHFNKFDTHIIIGFPGETDDAFQETIDFLIHYRPAYVLASCFFCVPNAPAAAFDNQVSKQIMQERQILAEKMFREAGIIYNIENTTIAQDRIDRMNKSLSID
jgi:tRNA A37 methylthiotransferase MiaB